MRRNLPSAGQRRAAARVRQRKKMEEKFFKTSTNIKPIAHTKPWNERFAAVDNIVDSVKIPPPRSKGRSRSITQSLTRSHYSTTDRADGIPIATQHDGSERYDRKAVMVTRPTSPFDEKRVHEILKMPEVSVLSAESKETNRSPDEQEIGEIENYGLALKAHGFESRNQLNSQSFEISIEQ